MTRMTRQLRIASMKQDAATNKQLRALWDTKAPQLKLTQTSAAVHLGVSQSAISQYLNGQLPLSLEAAIGWADLLQCEVKEVAPGLAKAFKNVHRDPIEDWDDPNDLPSEGDAAIQRLDGSPGERALFSTAFLRRFGWNGKTHKIMTALNDCFRGTVPKDSPVVVDTSDKSIQSGKIYAIPVDGEPPALRRIEKLPGGKLRLRCDDTSPEHSVVEVSASDVVVLGRAVWTAQFLS